MNISKKNDRIIKSILVLAAIMIVMGMTYALLNKTLNGTKDYILASNGLKVYLDESKTLTDIVGENAIPVADYQGIQNESYIFSIKNDNITAIDYNIYLVLNNDNTMPSYGMKYNLLNDKLNLNKIGNIDDKMDKTGKLLYSGYMDIKSETEFNLKLWLGIEANDDCKNKKFSAKIVVTTIQNVKEKDKSGAPVPAIKGDLIPVTFGENGNAIKADTAKEWYNYDNKEWANAVILEDKSKIYDNGSIIPESNIQSYFVWVPRFKYKLFNVNNKIQPQEIEIQFEDKSKSTTNGTQNGEWLTHPAFTSFDSNGIWVGKFESGYKGAKNPTEAQININDSTKLLVKPNIYSWRSIDLGNAFNTCYNYQRSLDSHMMKNTEWGATAYLTNSKYGRCNKGVCSEVTINNNQDFITGLAGNTINEVPTTSIDNKFYTDKGVLASTTGNITGIYDMVGGVEEYVMGYTNTSLTPGGSSGLTTEWLNNPSNKKYYDLYTSNSISDYIKGDATLEVKDWNQDYAFFIYEEYPWFKRGGDFDHGVNTGIFAFRNKGGSGNKTDSFRITLIP